MHREPKITLNHEPKRNKTTMLDLQIQKAQCLCDLTDALPHYRKQLDRIDGRKKTAGGYRWKFKEQ